MIYDSTFPSDPEDEAGSWLNEPIQFTHNDSIYVIYPMEKSWDESREFCNERGSVLAYMNDINVTNLIVEAMGDHPKGIHDLDRVKIPTLSQRETFYERRYNSRLDRGTPD